MRDHIDGQVPLIAEGRIKTPEQAAQAIEAGLSLVAIGQSLVINPDWMAFARAGHVTKIHLSISVDQVSRVNIPPKLWAIIDATPGPGGYGMLLKRVFVVAGDNVSIYRAGIVVNGELMPNSAKICADGDGHEMPQYRLDEKMLSDYEYLLMCDVNPNSFDARYFGLIAHVQIRHFVESVFTWGIKLLKEMMR